MHPLIFDTEKIELFKRLIFDKYDQIENNRRYRIISICSNSYKDGENVNSNYHIITPNYFQINNKSKL